eukprot:GHVN01072755.1.p1 GENE.GHVN01072755.1~~GHVN01072755.1.p1  ORF type:complete len:316 (-),score=12.49 GHVN01072755.1:1346-2257(-)
MYPCTRENIPIKLASAFSPTSPATLIGHKPYHRSRSMWLGQILQRRMSPTSGPCCKAFTMIENITLVNLEGTHLISLPGVARRMFTALDEAGCTVVVITQASSEHSISVAMPAEEAPRAEASLHKEFFREMSLHETCGPVTVSITPKCTVVSTVGDNMAGTKGVLGRLSSALGEGGVNIRAVAQGSSERNVTFLVPSWQGPAAVSLLHSAIYGEDGLASDSPTETLAETSDGEQISKSTLPIPPKTNGGIIEEGSLSLLNSREKLMKRIGIDLQRVAPHSWGCLAVVCHHELTALQGTTHTRF